MTAKPTTLQTRAGQTKYSKTWTCANALLLNRSVNFFAWIFILFENIYLFVFLCIRKSSIKVTYKPEEERKQSESAEKVGFVKRKANYRNRTGRDRSRLNVRLNIYCKLAGWGVIGCLIHRPLEDQSDVSLLTTELLGTEGTGGVKSVRSVREGDLTPIRRCLFRAHVTARTERVSGRGRV